MSDAVVIRRLAGRVTHIERVRDDTICAERWQWYVTLDNGEEVEIDALALDSDMVDAEFYHYEKHGRIPIKLVP